MDKLNLILSVIFFFAFLGTLISAIFGNCTLFAPFIFCAISLGLFIGYKKSLN